VESAIARPSIPVLVGIAGIVVLLVASSMWFGSGTVATASGPSGDALPNEVGASGSGYVVHVSGAVQRPGLVTVPRGSRVADVISAAGGALRWADLSSLNLAAAVRDAEHLHVPAFDASAESAGPPAEAGVDLNAADAAALESLPGVGPVLAARIVAFREDHGPFATVEDLLEVPGIGEAKLAQIRDEVSSP
jgi:competence protein ComEA